ncbi:MAG TPA: glycoside hydrolase family 172 protein [Planctomycetota bacterium]|jgi:hypothetical protein|nr:glycoside hydrolase family 172 protein [Planctomycetota bacterium]
MSLAPLFLLLAQDSFLDPLTRLGEGRSRRVSSASPDPESNRDNLRVAPGETRTLAELKGPGVIRHVWLTFPEARPSWLAEKGGARPDEVVLRIFWDGAEAPAVESPVGDFFACGFGERREVRSIPVQVDEGDSYNCFWPMPFSKSARITLANESERPLNSTYFQIDWEEKPLPDRTPNFCARYRQEFPAAKGRDYRILDAEGEGHYVGTVLSVRTRSPEWFGEGDDCFYVDGEETPSIRGTGTEDYFLSAWGLRAHTLPYSGTPLLEGGWGHIGQRLSAYRWHLLDPVRFKKSLRVTIEHKGWVPGDEKPDGKIHGHTERFDDFASVAFWYQVGTPKALAPFPPANERVPPLLDRVVEGKVLLERAKAVGGEAVLQKGYEWTGDGQLFFRATSPDASIELPFEVKEKEYRALVLPLTRSYDYGAWRILLDGVEKVARIDLYAPQIKVEEVSLGSSSLDPGTHVLRFEAVGKNPLSGGSFLGVDSVRLRERVPPR